MQHFAIFAFQSQRWWKYPFNDTKTNKVDISLYFENNNNGWIDKDEIPDSLIELFNEVGKVYIPCLIANAKAFENGDEIWETSIDGSIWKQKTFPYQVKCLKWIKDEFNKLSTDNKKLTLRLLAGSGCESILD